MYSVRLGKRAVKDLDVLPDDIGRRVQAALQSLAVTPRPSGCKRLQGAGGTYRIRIGDYRAPYDVDDDKQVVLVLRVQHRRDAYRGL